MQRSHVFGHAQMKGSDEVLYFCTSWEQIASHSVVVLCGISSTTAESVREKVNQKKGVAKNRELVQVCF